MGLDGKRAGLGPETSVRQLVTKVKDSSKTAARRSPENRQWLNFTVNTKKRQWTWPSC